jgi:hypothetical protein
MDSWLGAAAALVLLLAQPANASGAPVGAAAAAVDYVALFDPESDGDSHQRQEANLLGQARNGDHAARCLAGRLYYQRTIRPTRVETAHAERAAEWLNTCVLGGDVNAMLAMAELDLAQGRPLEAAVWTQAYLKLVQVLGEELVGPPGKAYQAALLARIDRKFAGRRPDNEELLEYVAGFLVDYGERIAAACRAGGCHPWPALPGAESASLTNGGKSYSSGMHRNIASIEDNAHATFLVEVDPRGRTQRAIVLVAYPEERSSSQLMGWAKSRRYTPAEVDGSRYLFLHGSMDNGMLELKPDAHSRSRGGR